MPLFAPTTRTEYDTLLRGLSRHAADALSFARQSPGWHSFKRDRRTTRALAQLAIRGLIQINQHNQFTATDAMGHPLPE